MNTIFLKYACWINNQSYNKIKNGDRYSRVKIQTFALALTLVVFLETVSGYSIGRNLLGRSHNESLLIGLGIGIIFFIIEKAIIIIKSDSKLFNFFRLALSLLFGCVFLFGTKAFLYKQEVRQQMEKMGLDKKEEIKTTVEKYHQKEIDEIDSNIKREVSQKQVYIDSANSAVYRNGFGPGRITKWYNNKAKEQDNKIAQLDSIKSVLNKNIENEVQEKMKEYEKTKGGFEQKLSAIMTVSFHDLQSTIISVVLILIFLLLELLVLGIKIFAKPSLLERHQQHIEDIQKNKLNRFKP